MDLPCAVTIMPTAGDTWPSNHDATDRHPAQEAAEQALRFSLAGVQLKFSAIQEASGGLTIPAKGVGGDWIVKLPSADFDRVPENEFSMMGLARSVGINVPETRLVALADIDALPAGMEHLTGSAFAIRRFDRADRGAPVHMEDFAQVFGVYPEDKYRKASYRNIATVLAAEGDQTDIAEFIRRLVFSMLIGNVDMHLKNWSLLYPDRHQAALSPAYDFVSTIVYLPDDKAALKVSRSRRFEDFTADELSHLAARARLPERLVLDTAAETVSRFREQWRAEKNHLPLRVRSEIHEALAILRTRSMTEAA